MGVSTTSALRTAGTDHHAGGQHACKSASTCVLARAACRLRSRTESRPIVYLISTVCFSPS